MVKRAGCILVLFGALLVGCHDDAPSPLDGNEVLGVDKYTLKSTPTSLHIQGVGPQGDEVLAVSLSVEMVSDTETGFTLMGRTVSIDLRDEVVSFPIFGMETANLTPPNDDLVKEVLMDPFISYHLNKYKVTYVEPSILLTALGDDSIDYAHGGACNSMAQYWPTCMGSGNTACCDEDLNGAGWFYQYASCGNLNPRMQGIRGCFSYTPECTAPRNYEDGCLSSATTHCPTNSHPVQFGSVWLCVIDAACNTLPLGAAGCAVCSNTQWAANKYVTTSFYSGFGTCSFVENNCVTQWNPCFYDYQCCSGNCDNWDFYCH